LKHKIQDLIDQRIVTLQAVNSDANGNSLMNRGGFAINMIDPKSQAPPRQNAPNYHQIAPPQQVHYDPPRRRLEKKQLKSLLLLLEVGRSCLRD